MASRTASDEHRILGHDEARHVFEPTHDPSLLPPPPMLDSWEQGQQAPPMQHSRDASQPSATSMGLQQHASPYSGAIMGRELSLQPGPGGLLVCEVEPQGKVDQTGKVTVGDILTEVNGASVAGQSEEEVLGAIFNGGSAFGGGSAWGNL
ncbi:hypothetical protein T484DRAFT_1780391 [Baffinella frigidus]|nr:hypothetical protein T484DRAFT_1780391 [Cryptophyta sp. CCMP2293]